jgi:hypothetical protein
MEEMNPNQTSQPRFIFRKERDLGEIISDTFSFFSQNSKKLMNIFLKFIGPFLLVTIIFSVYYQYKTGDLLSDFTAIGANPEYFFDAFGENLLVFILSLLSTLATYVVLYGTVLHIIKSYIDNNGEILEQDVSDGLKRDFLPLTGYFLLNIIVVIIGLILCILPGVYIAVVVSPGIALLVMEKKSVGDTFSKCFKIIKDNWWITFATVLVFGILISILGVIFDLPITIYAFVEGFTGFSDSSFSSQEELAGIYQNWIYLVFAAISVLGQFFLSIFNVISTALIYFNLSERQEFTGTYDQIDQIGN